MATTPKWTNQRFNTGIPEDCTCGAPVVRHLTVSGHAHNCPIHAAWLILQREADAQDTPSNDNSGFTIEL